MKTRKFFWLFSAIIIFAMIITAFVFLPKLPQQIAVQWNESGATSFTEKYIVFVFPLLAIVIAILQFLQYNKSDNQRKYGLLNSIISLVLYILQFVICLNAIEYFSIENINLKLGETIVMLIFGILLMYFGNKLPKYARNFYIGVKASWAYEDDDVWTKTQRFAGKVWFFGGLFIILLGIVIYFVKAQVSATLMLLCLLIIIFAPRIYSKYLFEHKS